MPVFGGAEFSEQNSEPQAIVSSDSSPTAPTVAIAAGDQAEAPAKEEELKAQAVTLAVPAARPVDPVPVPQPFSVIGADLAISGQEVHVISKGRIRVEGKIQGDVLGTEVVIGDLGTVEGVVSGDTVRVFGVIMGTIRGVQVEIEAGAKVEADIHHHSLSVNSRAHVDGRVCRIREKAEPQAASNASGAHHVPPPTPPPPPRTAQSRNGRLWR